MKFIKIDPITGAFVSTGSCPDDELVELDHEGLLTLPIEGAPHEYQFDHETMSLVKRVTSPIVELRKRLIAERRVATPEELNQLTGPEPVLTPKL